MRTLSIIFIILALTSAALAQGQMVPVAQSVNINLENVPLKQALQEIMQYTGGDYALSQALDAPPYDKVVVSLRVRNANYGDALSNLLRTNNLEIITSKLGVRTVQPIDPNAEAAGHGQVPGVAAMAQPDLVTVNVPAMSVKDALALVCPRCGWVFDGDLGQILMPGAKFYQFPREMAAAIVLTAAGLVPPTGNSKAIAIRGRVSLESNYQYMPQRAQNQSFSQSDGYAAQNYMYANQVAGAVSQSQQEGISIAAYIVGNQMLFTILANGAADTVLLERLLSLSGRSYVMGDLSVRPENAAYAKSGVPGTMGPGAPQSRQVFAKPKAVTAQLRNVTLEKALDNLLPACRLQYRKTGPVNNPTYMVETMASPNPLAPEPSAASVLPSAPPPKRTKY